MDNARPGIVGSYSAEEHQLYEKSGQPRDSRGERLWRIGEILLMANAAHDEDARDRLLRLPEIEQICRQVVTRSHGWWMPCYTDADDLLQEVRIRILGKLSSQESFASARNFLSWVRRIAHNQYVSGQKKSRREAEGRKSISEGHIVEGIFADLARASGLNEVLQPCSQLDEIIKADLYHKLLDRLPDEDKSVVTMWCQGGSLQEVGRSLGIAHHSTVRRRLGAIVSSIHAHFFESQARAYMISTGSQITLQPCDANSSVTRPISIHLHIGHTASESVGFDQCCLTPKSNLPMIRPPHSLAIRKPAVRRPRARRMDDSRVLKKRYRKEQYDSKPLSRKEIAYIRAGVRQNEQRRRQFRSGLVSLYVDGVRYPEFHVAEETNRFVIPLWTSSIDVFGCDRGEEVLLAIFDIPELDIAPDNEPIRLVGPDDSGPLLELLVFPPDKTLLEKARYLHAAIRVISREVRHINVVHA